MVGWVYRGQHESAKHEVDAAVRNARRQCTGRQVTLCNADAVLVSRVNRKRVVPQRLQGIAATYEHQRQTWRTRAGCTRQQAANTTPRRCTRRLPTSNAAELKSVAQAVMAGNSSSRGNTLLPEPHPTSSTTGRLRRWEWSAPAQQRTAPVVSLQYLIELSSDREQARRTYSCDTTTASSCALNAAERYRLGLKNRSAPATMSIPPIGSAPSA